MLRCSYSATEAAIIGSDPGFLLSTSLREVLWIPGSIEHLITISWPGEAKFGLQFSAFLDG
jgi:hypothetical protein